MIRKLRNRWRKWKSWKSFNYGNCFYKILVFLGICSHPAFDAWVYYAGEEQKEK